MRNTQVEIKGFFSRFQFLFVLFPRTPGEHLEGIFLLCVSLFFGVRDQSIVNLVESNCVHFLDIFIVDQ